MTRPEVTLFFVLTFWFSPILPGQVPAVFLCTQYWRHDLVGLYTGMAIGYALLVILYSYITLKRYVDTVWQDPSNGI